MSSTAFLARLLGLFTLAIAAAILINRRGIIAAMESLRQHGDTLLLAELIGLGAGLAIVISHEVWTSVLGIIVTLLGWFILLRALILLLLPPEKIAELFALVAWPQRAETYAMISLVIGILLTVVGFAAAQTTDMGENEMAERSWYIAKQFLSFVATGQINADTLVWTDGMAARGRGRAIYWALWLRAAGRRRGRSPAGLPGLTSMRAELRWRRILASGRC